ncbi:MAG: hypothetical protein KBH07_05310 [Flavobacteriales bacterium]|nr:hypothetical protein [Flavobacteriales bacterium]MBP9080054.1 hypothetical protein [Flavobacteriales bacterium]
MPQADGARKARPAVLLCSFPPFGDWLVLGISSSIGLAVPGLDLVIHEEHPSYTLSRLDFTGVVRLGHANVVPVEWIEGIIGRVDPETLQTLTERFVKQVLKGE